jgi:hypothetical protein
MTCGKGLTNCATTRIDRVAKFCFAGHLRERAQLLIVSS